MKPRLFCNPKVNVGDIISYGLRLTGRERLVGVILQSTNNYYVIKLEYPNKESFIHKHYKALDDMAFEITLIKRMVYEGLVL